MAFIPLRKPRRLPGIPPAAAVAIVLMSLALYTTGSLAMRSSREPTRYGVPADAWPGTLRILQHADDSAGFRVRYVHDLPEGWRLLGITTRGGDGAVAAELAYGRESDGREMIIQQRRMAPPPLDTEDIAIRRGARAARLRRLPDDEIVVAWQDGSLWIEATSHVAADWDASDVLWALDSVY